MNFNTTKLQKVHVSIILKKLPLTEFWCTVQEKNRERVSLPPPAHCPGSGLKDIPISPSESFNLRDRLRLAALGGATEPHRGKETPSLNLHLASPQLADTSRKGDYTFVWSPDFFLLSPRAHLQISWPGNEQVYNCGPTGLYTFAYLKSCCLMILLPISLKLDAIEITPFGTLVGLGTPSITRTFQEWIRNSQIQRTDWEWSQGKGVELWAKWVKGVNCLGMNNMDFLWRSLCSVYKY